MATEFRTDIQSRTETRTYTLDFSDDLREGVTVLSAVATHTPPSGDASSPVVSVSSPNVAVTLGEQTVRGIHYVEVLATLSDGDTSSARLIIPVVY